MQCSKCKFENRDNAKYCGECGHQLGKEPPGRGVKIELGSRRHKVEGGARVCLFSK